MKSFVKTATINDVASHANVSITTVSRYLNGRYENMSEETRQRIAQVIAELDYRPNNLARGLKSQNSMTIGCVVADMANPFSSLLIKGINAVCWKNNYKVLIIDADNNPEYEKEAYKSLLNNPVEGIITNTTGWVDDEIIALSKAVHVVLADRVIETPELIDSVVTDNAEATYNCLKYLKKQGYQKVGLFTPPTEKISTRTERLRAFEKGAAELFDEAPPENTFFYDPQKPDTLTEALRAFASANFGVPSAIFSVNGEVTLQLLHSMRDLSLTISPNLGLCGFDDWGWSDIVPPGITTIVPDSYDIGVKSAQLLFKRIRAKKNSPAQTLELKNTLFERGSTKRF